jgi:zona occludens toxin
MAVSMYTGHVGSGKTYEVVKYVILPALALGRSVVANIDGLNPGLIREYLEGQDHSVGPGVLVVVTRQDMVRPDFFPRRLPDGSYLPSQFVPLGALVVIDEASLIFGESKPLSEQAKQFFAEHRHIVSESGVACDLVVISQTVGGVHRGLRSLVEFSVDCGKLNALGMSSKYTAVTYEGAKRSGKYVMGRVTRSYDKKIFPLYKSFSTGSGVILQTDKRFTIWSSKLFWLTVVFAPFVIVAGLYKLYHDFRPHKAAAVVSTASARSKDILTSSTSSGSGDAVSAPGVSSFSPSGKVSAWVLVGSARFYGFGFAVVSRPGYPLRYVPLSACVLSFDGPVSCSFSGELFLPAAEAASPSLPTSSDLLGSPKNAG